MVVLAREYVKRAWGLDGVLRWGADVFNRMEVITKNLGEAGPDFDYDASSEPASPQGNECQ